MGYVCRGLDLSRAGLSLGGFVWDGFIGVPFYLIGIPTNCVHVHAGGRKKHWLRGISGNFHHTVCPRSFDPFYIVSYYIKWVKPDRQSMYKKSIFM